MNNSSANPVLTIHIAVVGEMPTDDKKAASMSTKIKRIVDIAISSANRFASDDYGFVPGIVNVRFLSSPELISGELLDKLNTLYPDSEIIGLVFGTGEETIGFSHVSVIEGFNRDEASSWLADQSDFAIACCDSKAYGNFVSECQASEIPTVIISTAQDGYSMWTEKSIYDNFDEEKLSAYIDTLFPDMRTLGYEKDADKTVLGYQLLWGGLYKRYMKRHGGSGTASQPPEDTLMNEKNVFGILNKKQEAVRQLLINKFGINDGIAIKYSEKYRSSIYLRAVIPLVTTIALAIGFYTESLFKPLSVINPGVEWNLWAIIAGLGFFMHALLNLYVFRLAENKTIQAWHKGFIDNRYIAEALRIITHFIPFGIPVNLNKTLSACGTKIKKDSDVARRLRCVLRSVSLPVSAYNSNIAYECMRHLRELIDGQIAYHKKTANELVNICNSLERWAKIIFYLGFGFVLFRGCLQLVVAFDVIPMQNTVKDWIRPFANMLALLIPTWAGYFNLKLSLCSFKTIYNNNVSIVDGLDAIKQMIYDINNKNDADYKDFKRLSEKTVITMLREISEWYGQIDTKTVTKL